VTTVTPDVAPEVMADNEADAPPDETPRRTDMAPRGPMIRLAHVLGCTEGQAYTVVLGVVLALVASLVGLPPTLRDRAQPAAASTAPTGGPAKAPPEGTASPTDDVATPPLVSERPGAPAGIGPAPTAARAPGSPAAPSSGAPFTPSPDVVFPPSGFGAAEVAAKVGDPGAPDGVAVDEDGRLYVATNNSTVRGGAGPSKVIRYGPSGKVDRQFTVEGQDSTRTAGLTGIVVAPDGQLLVLDSAPARVLRIDLDRGRQTTYAPLPDLQACAPAAAADGCEPGPDDRPRPRALTRDPAGNLFVTDSGQRVIWRIPPGGEAAPWYVFADDMAGSGPTGVALDGAGDVLVVTSMAVQGSNGAGVVQRIDVRPDGTAGRRTTVASTDPLSGPVGLSTTPGGGIVVALTAANELLLLGPDGAERARLTADQVAEQAGVPLDGPTGVAVHDGSVLVTNQSPTANDETHWVVFDVPLTT